MGRKRKAAKDKKKKRVSYAPIERTHAGKVTEPYKIMEALIGKHHKDLLESDARILMGWDTGPAKEDVDGHVKVGRVKRGSDVDRSHGQYDFLVIIRLEVFDSFDETRKQAEIDRLLCRCAVTRGSDGEVVEDEDDRSVFRLRRPVEVFPENVARFGFHQEPKLADCLARFNDSKRPLLDKADKAEKKRGRKFSEPAKGVNPSAAPSANGQSDNGSAAAWRNVPIEALGLPGYLHKALDEAGLSTLGDIDTHERSNETLAGIFGVSDKGIEILKERIATYRAEHREQFEQQEEAAA